MNIPQIPKVKRITTNAAGRRVVSPMSLANTTLVGAPRGERGRAVAYETGTGKMKGYVKVPNAPAKGIGLAYDDQGKMTTVRTGKIPGRGDVPTGNASAKAPEVPTPQAPTQSAASQASTANAWMGDPQRLAALNRIGLEEATGLADLQAAASADERNTQASRETLARSLAGNRVGRMRSANKMGLAKSGYQDRQQADLTGQFGRDTTNLEASFQDRVAERARRANELRQAALLSGQEADQGAVERQIERDQSLGVPDLVAQAAAAVKAPPYRAVNKTDSKGRKGKVHIYPDGRRVFVPSR